MLSAWKATEADALSLAKRLRPDDLYEVTALGRTPEDALLDGVRLSKPALVGVDEDNVPQIMFGVVPIPASSIGLGWLLASDEITKHRKQILRQSQHWIKAVSANYTMLYNFVNAKNLLHIRWLEWAGFTFGRTKVHNGEQYIEFYKEIN